MRSNPQGVGLDGFKRRYTIGTGTAEAKPPVCNTGAEMTASEFAAWLSRDPYARLMLQAFRTQRRSAMGKMAYHRDRHEFDLANNFRQEVVFCDRIMSAFETVIKGGFEPEK